MGILLTCCFTVYSVDESKRSKRSLYRCTAFRLCLILENTSCVISLTCFVNTLKIKHEIPLGLQSLCVCFNVEMASLPSDETVHFDYVTILKITCRCLWLVHSLVWSFDDGIVSTANL